jgi:large subunit ribosomal protein L18
MSKKTSPRLARRMKIKKRIRKRVTGTPDRPRLLVVRSLRQISVQIVDDTSRKTLISVTSLSKALSERVAQAKSKTEVAKLIGLTAGEAAKAKQITRVVFDRNGYLYHGRVKAVADGAREAGLQF